MSAQTAHRRRNKHWGHDLTWTLAGKMPSCTVKFEPVEEQQKVDFTSLEDARAGLEVTQLGTRKLGAKVTVMVPKEGEAPCEVLEMLKEAAKDPDARVGPLVVTRPEAYAMTIDWCSVKRASGAFEKNSPLTVTYELEQASPPLEETTPSGGA